MVERREQEWNDSEALKETLSRVTTCGNAVRRWPRTSACQREDLEGSDVFPSFTLMWKGD